MSVLTFLEKYKLEKLLSMGGGYVLDFSNRTFQEFVGDVVGKNIYSNQYDYASGSKANRLRAFWKVEPNHTVGRLMTDMIDYAETLADDEEQMVLVAACRKIAKRLLDSAPVADLDAIAPNSPSRTFDALAKSVRESIENNEPEAGLDRLHTFVVKYMRTLCGRHSIATGKDKPLHSCFGEYIKFLRSGELLGSEMTERILKSSISILDAFNDVRNNKSFAHDNELLGYDESLLIFNNVSSLIRFLEAVEARVARSSEAEKAEEEPDVPF